MLHQLPRQLSRSSSRQDVNLSKIAASAVESCSFLDGESKIINGLIRNRVLDDEFLRSLNAKVICGPVDLAVGLDLNDQNGLIQFSSPRKT